MRWTPWRPTDSDSETLDSELLSLFAESSRLPEVGVSDLARGRARVAAQLAPETAPPVAGGWLRRRFAWSAAGGGSMWAALLGTAFASKASTAAVGLTVLLAGAGTAEVTGIGPAVRESLGIAEPSAGSDVAEQSVEAQDNDLGLENEDANEQAADVVANEETPGNLVTNIRPDGTFSLRGIVRADGIETSTGAILGLGDVEVMIPGQPTDEEPNLDDYEGFLAQVTGSCKTDAEDFDIALDCTIESVTILGQAGQGQPEGTGQPDVLPGNAPEDAGQPEDVGPDSLPTQAPEGVGQQDEPGQPEDTPPVNAPGGNPNID